MKEPVLLFWSGGKDSMLALHAIRRGGEYDVAALVTTVDETSETVGMHGVRRELLVRQAEALGESLCEVRMPAFPPNEVYEARIAAALAGFPGVSTVAFGDLFLEDIREYRERILGRFGLRGLYPIWKRDTAALARELVADGFRAVLVCVDLEALDRSFAGRVIDDTLLSDLPPEVDPCGENGEFHTFVYDGPGFRAPVSFARGAVREEAGFAFCDLVAA